jgi:WD40 repeat protein
MILPNDDVKIISSHNSGVLKIFSLDFNKPYHFLSLSDNGEIYEWLFDKTYGNIKEIENCNLQRPSDEILIINKHEIKKIKKGDYIKITCAILFENFLTIGYDDGLILVYQIEKQNAEPKKQDVQHEKIVEENQEEEEQENKKAEEPKKEEKK